jgi:hypothetical protein
MKMKKANQKKKTKEELDIEDIKDHLKEMEDITPDLEADLEVAKEAENTDHILKDIK